jgi:hypothetical protein
VNLKDLSGTTILLAILYFTAYGFYSGFSDFFGFPTSFISIGVPELVKYSVVASGIIFSLLALLHFDTAEKYIPFFVVCFFVVLAGLLMLSTFYFMGGKGYLFDHNVKQLIVRSALIGIFALMGVRSISVFVRNGLRFTGKTHGVMLIGSVVFLPGAMGWAFAYLPYDTMFYSKDNKAYILANYSNNFVLGRCIKERSEFLLLDKINGEVTPVSNKEMQELKTCFLRASRKATNQS